MKNPIKYSIKTEIYPFIILLLTVIVSVWSYPSLPDLVVSHWDFAGKANGWSSREFHAIFFPVLIFALYTLLSLLPKLDPRSERYTEFASAYLVIRNFVLLTLFVIFSAATLANLGYAINIGATIMTAVGLLMIVLGSYLGKIKRNFFIGIRTPWTLSSDMVWDKTHRVGGILFIIWGISLIFVPWLVEKTAFIILFGGLIILLLGLTIYSYYLYQKEQKKLK